MKILRISGENLASLEGKFEVDFTSGPLASASLIAICGPTGAGKSTLLDALSAALFNATPRLANRGGVPVGDEADENKLGSNDVRSLLRRGAGYGRATVYFVGRDGKTYRAEWTARRARGRADGRPQAVQHALYGANGEVIEAGGLGDVAARIEEKLGLDFGQFQRSVLLAQGDFAAFLKAKPDERSTLLEQMTGTEIYSRISSAAHHRAATAVAAFETAMGRAEGIAVLSVEERNLREAELARARQVLREVIQGEETARAAVQWHAIAANLRVEAETARSAHLAACAARDTAEPLRLELADARKAERTRGAFAAFDRVSLEAARCKAIAAETTAAVENAQKTLASAERQHAEARAGQANETQRADAARPLLLQARELDTLLMLRRGEAEKARAHEKVERGALAKLAREVVTLEKQAAARDAAGIEASRWLAERTSRRPLVDQWPAVEQGLARLTKVSADVERIAAQVVDAGNELQSTRARAQAATATRQQAASRLSALEKELRGAEEECARADPLTLEAALAAAMSELRVAEQLAAVLDESRRQTEAAAAARKEMAASDALVRSGGVASAEAQAKVRDVRSRLEESRGLADQIHRTLGMEGQRKLLVDEEPCPLCGACEHPYARGNVPALGTIDQRIRDLEKELELQENRRELSAALVQVQRNAAGLHSRQVAACEAALGEAGARWADLGGDQSFAPLAEADGGAVRALKSSLSVRCETAKAELAKARSSEQKRSMIERQAQGARQSLSAAEKAELTADAALAAAMARVEEGNKQQLKALEELDALQRQLAEPLSWSPGWMARFAAEPAGFTERIRGEVAEHRRREAELASATVDAQTLRARAEATAVGRDEQFARHSAAADSVLSAEKALNETAARRGVLLDGREVAAFEGELHATLTAAGRRVEMTRTARDGASAGLNAAMGRLDVARVQADAKSVELDSSSSEMHRAMAQADLAEGVIRGFLARSATWADEQQAKLDGLERAVSEARARVDDAIARQRSHDQLRMSALDQTAAAAAFEAAGNQREITSSEVGRIEAELSRDAADRGRRAEFEREVERARAASRVWRQLDELIGSADGKKLRSYAQGLTLEMLLAAANEHLLELARRYRLERVPGADLAIQVRDLDMAGEVRSTNTLSGGEGFLVSLALALGLSSLACGGATLQSLFIDEGFGTLDPRTLDMAVAALEQLREGGRQVAVITHVAGLADRIGARVQVQPLGTGRSVVTVS